MAIFTTLYSGSSGNCALVRDGDTTLLVDMGCSCKRTLGALYELGFAASDLSGILITHEHSDHVSGLMTFLKHYHVPVYGAPRTLEYLRAHDVVPDCAQLNDLTRGEPVSMGALSFRCFGTSHDSVDCLGYRFSLSTGSDIAVATDLGFVSEQVHDALRGCALVALESNYDEERLRNGPYPYYLKNRIRSNTGHLSNTDSANTAAQLVQEGAQRLVLMHLSKENNEPELAETCCRSACENAGISDSDVHVHVAPRYTIGDVFEV